MNDNEIVITKGLAKDERVMLTVPANAAQLALQALPPGSKPVPAARVPSDTAVPTPVKTAPDAPATPAPGTRASVTPTPKG
jgi:hypothetical protein